MGNASDRDSLTRAQRAHIVRTRIARRSVRDRLALSVRLGASPRDPDPGHGDRDRDGYRDGYGGASDRVRDGGSSVRRGPGGGGYGPGARRGRAADSAALGGAGVATAAPVLMGRI